MKDDIDMAPKGHILIGGCSRPGAGGVFTALDAASGEPLQPSFGGAGPVDVEEACALAEKAFDAYRDVPLEYRACLLETIADNIMALGDMLVERCAVESALPRARIEGERARTAGQLRMFAAIVREGGFLGLRFDPAQAGRKPAPRVELRLRNVPLGPVAVFGASNFPLAFSVAGGDTASALAAGCPVVVKAHPAHPGTSELVGRAIQRAVRSCDLPDGIFSLLFDHGHEVGGMLVADSRVKAVGFTGSHAGGMALMQIAAARSEPIPVYAEMSAINPVLIFPEAMAVRGQAIAKAFVASMTMGAGQFCTNPGLVLAVRGAALDDFLRAAAAAVRGVPAAPMLTPDILRSFCAGVERLSRQAGVEMIARGQKGQKLQAQAALFTTDASHFLADHVMHEEVFGPSSLVVRCSSEEELVCVVRALEGQLTAALHIDEGDYAAAQRLLPLLERKAGRLLVNGFGTGVEVGHAMVHGGPFPATSDGRSTSVGSLAIGRFLRPVSYQDMPAALLPAELRDDVLAKWPRHVDGVAIPGAAVAQH